MLVNYSDEVNHKQISGWLNHGLIWMIQQVVDSRCVWLMVNKVKFRGAIYSLVKICQNCSHGSYLSSIVCLKLWYQKLLTVFEFSVVPECSTLIPMLPSLSILDTLGRRVTKAFRLFTDSTTLNTSHSTALENCSQLLNSAETDTALFITIYPRIETLPKQYRVDVLYPKMRPMYFQIYPRITAEYFLAQ